jgi:hypothetical protein
MIMWGPQKSTHSNRGTAGNSVFYAIRAKGLSVSLDFSSVVWYSLDSNNLSTEADWDGLARAVVICKMWKLAIVLQLLIVTICKLSINPISNPNPIYGHSYIGICVWYVHIYLCTTYLTKICIQEFTHACPVVHSDGILKYPLGSKREDRQLDFMGGGWNHHNKRMTQKNVQRVHVPNGNQAWNSSVTVALNYVHFRNYNFWDQDFFFTWSWLSE